MKQVDGDVHKVGVCEECNFLVKSINFYIIFVSHGCFHTHGNLKIKFKKEFSCFYLYELPTWSSQAMRRHFSMPWLKWTTHMLKI